jgi:hypothetical protein
VPYQQRHKGIIDHRPYPERYQQPQKEQDLMLMLTQKAWYQGIKDKIEEEHRAQKVPQREHQRNKHIRRVKELNVQGIKDQHYTPERHVDVFYILRNIESGKVKGSFFHVLH